MITNANVTRGRIDQPRNHPQGRGLATAARAEQCDQFTRLNLEVDTLDDGIWAARVTFGQFLKMDGAHALKPPTLLPAERKRAVKTSTRIAGATKTRLVAAVIA